MKRCLMQLARVALLYLLGVSVAAAAPMLSVTPQLLTFNSGTQLTTNIDISGLVPNRALGTFDIVIDFDPLLLQFDSATFGNQLDLFGFGDIRSVTLGVGTVELFELSLESTTDLNNFQQTAFRLATLTFSTLGSATNSPLGLSIVALGDSSGNSLLEPVPEPSSVWLMLLGGVGLLFAILRASGRENHLRQC